MTKDESGTASGHLSALIGLGATPFEQNHDLVFEPVAGAPSALEGRRLADVLEDRDDAARAEAFARAVLEDGVADRIDLEGEGERLRIWAAPRTDAAGRVTGLVGALLRLPGEPRPKDGLLTLVAHELRNPLSPMRMALQLLQRTRGARAEDRAEWAVGVMDQQLTLLTERIDDLSALGRLERGVLHLDRTDVRLACVLEDARAALLRHHPEAEGRLRLVEPPDDLRARADRVQLTRAVATLLERAERATRHRGDVELRAARAAGAVVVVVEDSGTPIAPHLAPHLFDPQTLADRRVNPDREETGLPFALARGLAEAHGGTLDVAAGTTGGTRIELRLPEEDPRDAVPEAPAPPAGAAAPVLLVDDHPGAVNTLRLLLEGDGHRVEVARDGAAALEVAADLGPGVVLLDLGLPGDLDGLEVARRLRARDPHVTLVALTGRSGDADRAASRDAGFDAHLVKPPDLDAIRRILAGRSGSGR